MYPLLKMVIFQLVIFVFGGCTVRFMTPAQLMNATSAEALETIAPLENDFFWGGMFSHIIPVWYGIFNIYLHLHLVDFYGKCR